MTNLYRNKVSSGVEGPTVVPNSKKRDRDMEYNEIEYNNNKKLNRDNNAQICSTYILKRKEMESYFEENPITKKVKYTTPSEDSNQDEKIALEDGDEDDEVYIPREPEDRDAPNNQDIDDEVYIPREPEDMDAPNNQDIDGDSDMYFPIDDEDMDAPNNYIDQDIDDSEYSPREPEDMDVPYFNLDHDQDEEILGEEEIEEAEVLEELSEVEDEKQENIVGFLKIETYNEDIAFLRGILHDGIYYNPEPINIIV